MKSKKQEEVSVMKGVRYVGSMIFIFFLGGGAGNGLRCFRKLSRID